MFDPEFPWKRGLQVLRGYYVRRVEQSSGSIESNKLCGAEAEVFWRLKSEVQRGCGSASFLPPLRVEICVIYGWGRVVVGK